MNRFLDRLSQGVLIGDGAMGTELDARGLPAGTVGALWNVERPEVVAAIHQAYNQAGAQLALTNTFVANRWSLDRHGLADRVVELNRAGAAVARQAVGPDGLVIGDIGPTGELVRPLGLHEVAEFEALFAEQAAALAAPLDGQTAPAVDALIVETMIAVEECAAAVRAAKAATGLPVVASMTFDYSDRRHAFFTIMGVSVEMMVEHLTAAGADVLGVNCGSVEIHRMAQLVEAIANRTALPLMAQPNAGTPQVVRGATVFRQTPADFAAGAPALVAAGARIVGGCCGTTPAHIAALVRSLSQGR